MAGVGAVGQAIAADVQIEPPPADDAPVSAGEIKVTSVQALSVVGGSVSGAEAGYVFVNEDNTTFKAPAQVYTGDKFTINLALANKSESQMDTQITVSAPEGMSVDVEGNDGVKGVVRFGADKWAFRLDADDSDDEPDLIITISVSGSMSPSYYCLHCLIEPLSFEGDES